LKHGWSFRGSPTAADPESAWRAAGSMERCAADRAARVLERLGVRAPLAGEPGYPEALRDLPDAPRVLFVRGRVAGAHPGGRGGRFPRCHAVWAGAGRGPGCRPRSSGLYRGERSRARHRWAAHRGALEAGGRSVAVLPGGLDAITPRHHAGLAEAMCVRGGLLSERASGPPPFRWTFLERNRLIAALSAATVVVEAAVRSGALADGGLRASPRPAGARRAGRRGPRDEPRRARADPCRGHAVRGTRATC